MKNVDFNRFYASLPQKTAALREKAGFPLTLTEKILGCHLLSPESAELERGQSFVLLRPDRVAMQDATAQMTILQFMLAEKDRAAVPSSVHCDHLIQAVSGAEADLPAANDANREVYDFLRTAALKYGIDFWKPGSGIIHQIVLENYAFPGGLMIGTDSHTPNAGGLGMAAVGVGGADAVDVLVGMPWEVLYPRITGVRLKGTLNGWCSGKDIILKLLEILTVKGGTNRVMEYFGPGMASLSCTAQATITNMGAELGATFSLFPFHKPMGDYLRATRRAEIAALAEKSAADLSPDPEVLAAPEKFYDDIVEIDLDLLEPYIVGPHSPDKARPVSRFAEEIRKEGYPEDVSGILIGSCTNSSYEDLGRAAHIARQGLGKGLRARSDLLISPGSVQVAQTAERDGSLGTLKEAGGKVLACACGPCIGQWDRKGMGKKSPNSILTTFNRNFPARNDGNPETRAFIASPEIAMAFALAGKFTFNPLKDPLTDAGGNAFMLEPPISDALPQEGFVFSGLQPGNGITEGHAAEVEIKPDSSRLQRLSPFKKWDGRDFIELPVLAKVKGKCTTDHISPAGPWLKYRGHLDHISDNMLTGAVNAFTGETGKGINLLSDARGIPYPEIAREYKAKGVGWVIVGDENYGEGSSREHAAMSPRFLGAVAVITRSIARIHETNLKKQGVLVLRFADPEDYDKVQETDRISISGLAGLSPGGDLDITLHHSDSTADRFKAVHSCNAEQIEWFKAGSALNAVKDR